MNLSSPTDLCQFFDVRDFFSDEMLEYLFDRKNRYSWLIIHDGQEDACDILNGKATRIKNAVVSKFVQGENFCWVIWWKYYLNFLYSTLNRFMKTCEKD